MSDIDPDPYLERDDFEELNANEADDYRHESCDDEDFDVEPSYL